VVPDRLAVITGYFLKAIDEGARLDWLAVARFSRVTLFTGRGGGAACFRPEWRTMSPIDCLDKSGIDFGTGLLLLCCSAKPFDKFKVES